MVVSCADAEELNADIAQMAAKIDQAPPVPVETNVDQEKGMEEESKYLIVLSKKGAMLRLHLAAGCWKAQTRSFASYELCDLDPVPRSLYSHYCHTCWPRAPPQGEPRSGSASGSSSDDSAEEGSESSEE